VNTPEAKRIVIGSCAAAGVLSAVADLSAGRAPRLRVFIGAMTAGAILAMLSEAAPTAAGMFALTLLATAVFVAGTPTWQRIGSIFQ
jgi:hypothetical protein